MASPSIATLQDQLRRAQNYLQQVPPNSWRFRVCVGQVQHYRQQLSLQQQLVRKGQQ